MRQRTCRPKADLLEKIASILSSMINSQNSGLTDRCDYKRLVEQGYDEMAESYLASKPGHMSPTGEALEQLAAALPEDASVLDLGCGAGVPSFQYLAQRFQVTGVDISARQLELAGQQAPGATLIRADMTEVDFPEGSFDAVVAFYSIIHVPREEQPELIRNIYGWLKPGGRFLASWPLSEWEGEEENWQGWGGTMWWSHFGREENLAMLRDAGFAIESAIERTAQETWLWVTARKTEEGM